MCLAAVGIWATVNEDSFIRILPPFTDQFMSHVNVGIFSITIGAVMTLLGLLGCCGAQKESKCLLIMVNLNHIKCLMNIMFLPSSLFVCSLSFSLYNQFFSIILIICIAEAAAAIVALVYSTYVSLALNHWPLCQASPSPHSLFVSLFILAACKFPSYSGHH